MKPLLVMFGTLIGSMSAWGMIRPRALINLVVSVWRKPWGMAFAVGVRLVLGLACLLAANETLFPSLYTVFGILALISAVALPLLGRVRVDRLIGYFSERSDSVIRLWLALGVVLGYFLVVGAL